MTRLGQALAITTLIMLGCAAKPTNPSFPVTVRQAQSALNEMRLTPRPLSRPVIVLAGFFDPGLASRSLAKQLRKITRDDRVIPIAFLLNRNFDQCRDRVIDQIQEAFPSDDPDHTVEIDVVAVSMGGLVARYATLPPNNGATHPRRLRIARLFTISTPHRGAKLATLPTFNRLQIDMRNNSAFLQQLNARLPDAQYELIPYTRLDDLIVGATNTAPAGQTPWWVPNRPFEPAHMFAYGDPRIVADIALRLRGDAPLTSHPPAPLPTTVP